MWLRRRHCFPPMEANVCNGAGILWSFSASCARWNQGDGGRGTLYPMVTGTPHPCSGTEVSTSREEVEVTNEPAT